MYGERKKAQPRGPLWVGTERSCSSLETVPSIPELGGGGVRISSVHLGTFSGH